MVVGGRHRLRWEASSRAPLGATMGLPSRRYLSDEELGKRDDDHKAGKPGSRSVWRPSPRYPRKRRLLAILLIALLAFLTVRGFVRWISGQNDGQPAMSSQLLSRLPREADKCESHGQSYNGPISFDKLPASLHSVARLRGYRGTNRNILFASASLKSASVMLPFACEMAQWTRNHVHFAFMGRDKLSVDDILKVNGIDRDLCDVWWHDARPDYTEKSSELRAQAGVEAALRHIHTFLRPQALISDDSANEDSFFVKGAQAESSKQGYPIIEIPAGADGRLMWMTRLDCGSLNAWHRATVDILIHAPPESSGSIIRLIKSLEKADYTGLNPPRLIIDLPAEIDQPTAQYLENLVWPPARSGGSKSRNGVILRHRIPRSGESIESASIRFMESFYPANLGRNHVLLLSPQVELSSLYFHYLTYALLEYKYSMYGSGYVSPLLGISLELPSFYLNGTTPFIPPTTLEMHEKYHSNPDRANAPFLWQAPNSNAALYFGDKWAEMHSFLSHRTSTRKGQDTPVRRQKLITETQPSWTEFFLELIRARSYSMLYPAIPSSEAMATVHNELYQPPEEFAPAPLPEKDQLPSSPLTPSEVEPIFAPDSPVPSPQHPESPLIPPSRPLHVVLPFAGDLPEIPHLPELSYSGDILSRTEHQKASAAYAEQFRVEVGGCKPITEGKKRKITPHKARDLFCLGDKDDELWEQSAKGNSLDEEERASSSPSSETVIPTKLEVGPPRRTLD